MPPGKCAFQPKWLTNDRYKNWVQADKSSPFRARCRCCAKSFDISNMGEAALRSHMTSQRHRSLVSAASSRSLVSLTNSSPSPPTPPTSLTAASSVTLAQPRLDSGYVSNNAVLKAETYWALNVVSKNYSFRSSAASSSLFQAMFPDSAIARDFQCGERKCNYLVTFGIAPFLHSRFVDQVRSAKDYVVLFDESLNAVVEMKQMDVMVRLWDVDKVTTRYFSSKFVGHAYADTLVDELYECCLELGLNGVHQLSMDGPNVNWKAFNLLSNQVEKESGKKLINVGSCGLHVLHNAFRDGCAAAKWDVDSVLSALHWLFKHSPARREDFVNITGSSIFPKKFCHHRWVENVPVAERALLVWPKIEQFVAAAQSGKVKLPKNKLFATIVESVASPLFVIRLNVFLSIAKEITPFLTRYQTDQPMLPFLGNDLAGLMRGLLGQFIKSEKLADATTTVKLMRFDVEDRANQKESAGIDVRFAADMLLKERRQKKKSDQDCLAVRLEVKQCLIIIVKKLADKSPLNYSLVRSLAWLTPSGMLSSSDKIEKHLRKCLQVLCESNNLLPEVCDDVVRQYRAFCRECSTNAEFINFQPYVSRLDTLLYSAMANNSAWKDLWKLVRILLLLSHGQASLERGFSINKEALSDNLSQRTLVAKRVVKDHIAASGGDVTDVHLSAPLLNAAASGRRAYQQYLDTEKEKKATQKKSLKRKAAEDELIELKAKRKRLVDSIAALVKSADDFAVDAESSANITLLSKSNALRQSAKEKTDELDTVDKDVAEKEAALKQY